MNDQKRSGGLSRRLMLSLGILGIAGGIAGLGTWAQFTDSTTAQHSVSTGTVDINITGTGTDNTFSEASTLVAAGDTIQRAVVLSVAGTLDLSGIDFSSSASTSSALDTDGTDGLQLQVDRCSVAWTAGGAPNARTYTCGGTTSSVLASGPVIRSSTTLSNLNIAGGATNYLRFTWTLPSAATNATHGGKSSVIDYNFVGAQRAATNR